jgi:hypothetical protein
MTFSVVYPLPNPLFSGHFKSVYDLGDGRYEHPGADLIYATPALTLGAPIVACADMNIVMHRPGDGYGDGSFGVCALGDHPDTPYWTVCGHMDADRVPFKTGDFVRQGQTIGYVGMTGKTTGPHCHWGMSKSDGGAFSPNRFLDGAAGIWRIGNPLLLDPEAYLAAGAPPAPPQAHTATLEDALATLGHLSDIVGDERLKAAARDARQDAIDGRLGSIEKAIYALVEALPKG